MHQVLNSSNMRQEKGVTNMLQVFRLNIIYE